MTVRSLSGSFFQKFFDEFSVVRISFHFALFRYIMRMRRLLYFFHRRVLQRLHRRFSLSEPTDTKPIRNDIQPPDKLIRILECREFSVYLEEGVLRNFFSMMEISNLPPCKRVNALLIFFN